MEKVNQEVKRNKVKEHFKKHGMKYVYGVGLVIVGGVCYKLGGHMNAKQTGGSIDKTIIAKEVTDKSVNINNTINILQQVGRKGHAGNIILCKETGELFASQNELAKNLNLNPGNVSKDLKKGGKIKGKTYLKVEDFNKENS